MSAERGFVLVNALVLVGALAAAAALLLARAEMSTARQAAWQSAAQAEAYLDAFDALAVTVLQADPVGGADHRGERWAQPLRAASLDRGEVSGTIADLQGRFNVNWLAVPDDLHAQQAFQTLLRANGLPVSLGPAISGFLSPGGPADADGYTTIRPRGGPVLDPRQLRAIPGLTADQFARLAPLIAALPSDTTLNINTAPANLLSAWIPNLSLSQARTLTGRRKSRPYPSIDAFLLDLPPAAAAEVDDVRLSIGSGWFLARGTAELDGRVLSRRTVLARHPLPVGVLVDYRLPDD
ncbi:type II secretion system minor pseudopilin GspK [Antarctobacter jejuensis]|uniref:type II secretion system minor pseudopilin GspK n=1 Tax=Antarctobacter jejuensis TaxID=1439938 RepID=UPI003FD28825